MGRLKVLLPDSLHFHKRNFKSLIDYLEDGEHERVVISEYDEIKALYGNYENHKSLFLKEYDMLNRLDRDELFRLKIFGVNLFRLAKAEMLSYLISKDNWLNSSISSNINSIFNKAYRENREDLTLNMAVTLFWLNFWHRCLGLNEHKDINIAIIFSGSLIYVKTLSYLLQNTPIKVFVVEHFFTGNDYYFEEKYDHIANNCDIGHDNLYYSIKKSFFEDRTIDRDRETIKAINRLNSINNKNVKQPIESDNIEFANKKVKTVLILGQVVNDFSILETELENINSLDIYKKMISRLLNETPYNIIFKAHPWERNKINLKRAITKEELNSYIELNFSDKQRSRVVIVEDFNIEELFKISDYAVSICSQSLLEAGYAGLKPHQIGKAFFGNRGFTYDYNSLDEFIENIKLEPNSRLTLDEYKNLIEFFTITLQRYLISNYQSGKKSINDRLNFYLNIKLIQGSSTLSEERNIRFINRLIENFVYLIASKEKTRKIKRNPRRYFKDAKHPLIRFLAKFYR